MSHPAQQLRFGVNLSTSATAGADPARDAVLAEQLGFDLIACSDHLHTAYPNFETWTFLTWVAAQTRRVMILSNVLGLPYRPPAVIAKMAESLHRLSGGRMILGLGAGAVDAEFAAFGLPVRSPGEKVAALEEALDIIQALWREPNVRFAGRHYAVDGATITPRPTSAIPIWLGTYGPKAVRLAAERADGWVPSMPYLPLAKAVERRAQLREAAAAAGRDPDALTCAYNITVGVGRFTPRGETIAGEPPEVAARLAEVVRAGFTFPIFWIVGDQRTGMERLAGEVLPRVRELVGG
ncbi:MAG: LLM class flavin-dependent oxidoreductase [Chloroflexota bacterium]|nr:LLM class flavin-dependent oxidoreductase [Dehalococcoidia bacterium]MDW8255178.1 LLM class flavin-dependent oxidoreductase [Chloroflexota bacterium]